MSEIKNILLDIEGDLKMYDLSYENEKKDLVNDINDAYRNNDYIKAYELKETAINITATINISLDSNDDCTYPSFEDIKAIETKDETSKKDTDISLCDNAIDFLDTTKLRNGDLFYIKIKNNNNIYGIIMIIETPESKYFNIFGSFHETKICPTDYPISRGDMKYKYYKDYNLFFCKNIND